MNFRLNTVIVADLILIRDDDDVVLPEAIVRMRVSAVRYIYVPQGQEDFIFYFLSSTIK